MKASEAALVVQALGPRQKGRILRHFLALSEPDRVLRFGNAATDDALADYVAQLDFQQDALFGLSRQRGPLLALAHLALRSKDKRAQAELGLSVHATARGQGLGSRLFSHTLEYCLKRQIDAFYMHCLASNQTMLHIARKAGMEIVREHDEAEAYLQLASPKRSKAIENRCVAA